MHMHPVSFIVRAIGGSMACEGARLENRMLSSERYLAYFGAVPNWPRVFRHGEIKLPVRKFAVNADTNHASTKQKRRPGPRRATVVVRHIRDVRIRRRAHRGARSPSLDCDAEFEKSLPRECCWIRNLTSEQYRDAAEIAGRSFGPRFRVQVRSLCLAYSRRESPVPKANHKESRRLSCRARFPQCAQNTLPRVGK